MPQFTLRETDEYYQTLLQTVRHAKKTINIASFDLIYDYKTKELLDAVVTAAKRGVHVTITADVYTFHEIRRKHFGPIDTNHISGKNIRKYVDKLRQEGGKFVWLGETNVLNPYKNRNHQKWSIIDDEVFCFGGINMYDAGLKNNDFMLHTHDRDLANFLRQEHERIIQNTNAYLGNTYQIDDTSTCYLDAAEPHASIIYRHACTLAQKSVAATYVSQYYPTGKLGRLLKKTKSRYYINRPSHMRGLAKYMIIFDSLRCRIENSYHKKRYLHAKFIIFTMKDGSKVALTGSHNFSYAGVRYGTVEIAMKTTNTHTINQLENFIQKISS
jgi:cardiolipin synthase